MPRGPIGGLLQGLAVGKQQKTRDERFDREQARFDAQENRAKQVFEFTKKNQEFKLAQQKTQQKLMDLIQSRLGQNHEVTMAKNQNTRDVAGYAIQQREAQSKQQLAEGQQAQYEQPQQQTTTPMGESFQGQQKPSGILDMLTPDMLAMMKMSGMPDLTPVASLGERVRGTNLRDADRDEARRLIDEDRDLSRAQAAKHHDESLAESQAKRAQSLKIASKPVLFKFKDKGIEKGVFIDPFTKQPVGEAIKLKGLQGLPAETSAKLTLITKGQEDLKVSMELIAPGGVVDRLLVANMDTRMPFSEGRRAKGLILAAVEGKLRAESGAAVPPEEVKRAAVRYLPTSGDSDTEIRGKLRRLDEWLTETARVIDPQFIYHKKPTKDLTTMSDADLLKQLGN